MSIPIFCVIVIITYRHYDGLSIPDCTVTRPDRTKPEKRRDYPQMVCGMGEKGLAPGRHPCWRTTSHLRAQPVTTTSIRALSKRDAGSHRLILSTGLICSGYLEAATRR